MAEEQQSGQPLELTQLEQAIEAQERVLHLLSETQKQAALEILHTLRSQYLTLQAQPVHRTTAVGEGVTAGKQIPVSQRVAAGRTSRLGKVGLA